MNALSGKGKLYHKGAFICEVSYEVWESLPKRGRIISENAHNLYLRFPVDRLDFQLEDGRHIEIHLRNMNGFFDIGEASGC